MAYGINNYGGVSDTLANPSLSAWAGATASSVAGIRTHTSNSPLALAEGDGFADHLIICNNTTQDITVTLPDPAKSPGREIIIKNISPSYKVTVGCATALGIDNGISTIDIQGYGYATFISNGGTHWKVVHGQRSVGVSGSYSVYTWETDSSTWQKIYSSSNFVTSAMLQSGLSLTGTTTLSAANIGANRITTVADKFTAHTALVTSSELISLISDETGTGNLVFNSGPTFTGIINGASLSLSGSLTAVNASFSSNLTASGGTSTLRDISASSIKTYLTNKIAAYQITNLDSIITCSGVFDVTLPTAVGIAGQQFIIRNIDTNAVTIKRTSLQTIDGLAADVVIGGKGTVSIVSDGSNWLILNGQYTDESIGRRMFNWSPALQGWQTIYSDTGSRDLSASALTNSWFVGGASAFYLSRESNIVNLVLTASGTSATSSTVFVLPNGFKPSSSIVFNVGDTNASAIPKKAIIYSTGSIAIPQYSASVYHINMSWKTNDSWPTVLPGTSNGSIIT